MDTQSGAATSLTGLRLPTDIEGVDALIELALDLHWSWNHATDHIWRQLDSNLWELTHNPWVILQTVSREHLATMLAEPAYRQELDDLARDQQLAKDSPAWFQFHHADARLTSVAYFSMEFMLSEALPIYSGGLGNVAGDQLKAASDLGVPVIGVGLLYQQGYFRQDIDQNGDQQELYPYNDPGQLPITPVRKPNGEWLRLRVVLPGYSVWLRTWHVQVGNVKLYLLDTNDPANLAVHRGITSELYGGGKELRLRQELVLGIGGWRLLQELGIHPEVCHLNEGHAAFAVLERARTFMETSGQPFEVAMAVTRAGNLFTTHTPVPAGFDRFSPALIEQYLARYAEDRLHIPIADLIALGQETPNQSSEFNMALLAIRGSGAINGVSSLHGEVSRRLFAQHFPRWPVEEVPIGHVTNGVHVPSWDSASADELWTQHCGKARWLGMVDDDNVEISKISDTEIWQLRTHEQSEFVDYVRSQLSRQNVARGLPLAEIESANDVLDPNTLTLVFARRFAPYKRPNLLLHDPDRLLRLLTNANRPVQLIIAGKAHPADQKGQDMIKEWADFIALPEARRHVAFLSDYNMLMAEHLVAGADVWVNTPRRPWEASGTSGMKVLVNGGINLSELDGWWAEAYTPEVGWSLGDGQEHGDDPAWDATEAEQLYDLLETEVIPEFYTRNENGIPTAWVSRMRASMTQLTSRFSATRSVKEYTEQHYLPAATAYHKRASNKGLIGGRITEWQHAITIQWPSVRFGEVTVRTECDQHLFDAQVYLGELPKDAVCVELYADRVPGHDGARHQMACIRQLTPPVNAYDYQARIPAERPASDYTARVIPTHSGVCVPLEAPQITWQK